MEFFNQAKAVRLKSHIQKYLVADEDELNVRQNSDGSSRKARWIVELVKHNSHVIRLRSCYDGRYLTASEEPYLLGMTGMKVLQTFPVTKNDFAAIDWEPIKDGYQIKLRTRGGSFLRANGATPPWRNSITHDKPYRTATQDWVLWDVDVVDISVMDSQFLPSSNQDFSGASSSTSSPTAGSGTSSPPSASHHPKRWPSSAITPPNRRPSIATSQSQKSIERSQEGIEFFSKAKSVRLQSHLGKYLVADDDEETVRQSRNGSSHRARWTVEFVDGENDKIRLKSRNGKYLTAADSAFLLGMTGKKVLQTMPQKKADVSMDWVPVKEGSYVKLMTNEGKFLRANGGTPPWRNSVTHDVPYRTATQNWVLWSVDVVDISLSDTDSVDSDRLSSTSSFCSAADELWGSPDTGSPVAMTVRSSGSEKAGNASSKVSGMEFFKKAKSVRLKSHHDKYLTADSDEETVVQDRSGTSRCAKWSVEFVEGVENVIRLKSCFGRYLTSLEDQFLLGVTGQKVVQSLPRKLDSSIEWEPIRDGMLVKLKTRYGNYLRANGGLPPWRNSITHDIPHRHHGWILWMVDVIEIRPQSPPKPTRASHSDSRLSDREIDLASTSLIRLRLSRNRDEAAPGMEESTRKSEGRTIYYKVWDEDEAEGMGGGGGEECCFQFKGHGVEELRQKLEEETGIEGVIVCSRNRVNGKLYPLKLALPPNNVTMHVVVVPSSSVVGQDLTPSAADE